MINRPSPAMAVAMTALVVAIGGTAGAEPIAHVAKAIAGKNIKKRSIPGNRIVADSLGGSEINESKLGKVPGAASADHAASADEATHAASADNAAALGGLAPGAFMQGGGTHVALRVKLPSTAPKGKLLTLGDTGVLNDDCQTNYATLEYLNNTSKTQDVTVTMITPNSPHAVVDYGALYGPGATSGLALPTQHWMVHAASDSGQATLDVTASYVDGGCVVDVEGVSTLALS
jgi:hypothetical protein